MRVIAAVSVVSILTIISAGCSRNAASGEPLTTQPELTLSSRVPVVIEDGSEFPAFLAGTWQADQAGWEITIDPNGTLTSAVISLGRFNMKPDRTTIVTMMGGRESRLEPGEWTAGYSPLDRELAIEITVKSLHIEIGDDYLEGKTADVFVGPVSQDGRIWHAEWISFPAYVAHTSEHPNFEMAEDPDYGVTAQLIFEKVQE